MAKTDCRIPIVIGVTGHRMIHPDGLQKIRDSVRNILLRIRDSVPSTEVCLLTNMAEGADQICAGIAKDMGLTLLSALPFPQEEYEKDFEGETLVEFRRILRLSSSVFTVSGKPSSHPERDALYRKAGEYIVSHCHLLLSLSNGAEEKKGGCGAAEITGDALRAGIPVLSVYTPKPENAPEDAGKERFLQGEEWMRSILSRTDRFNRQAAALKYEEKETEASAAPRLEAVFYSSDELSKKYAGKFRTVLTLLAVLGSLFTFCFLLYDELCAYYLIVFCGLFLLTSFLCLRYSEKSGWHKDYLEYRVLSEALRVQKYLLLSGSTAEVPELVSWMQTYETPWIPGAVSALLFGCQNGNAVVDVREEWIRGQRDYHLHAADRNARAFRNSRIITTTAAVLSAVSYLALLGMELFLTRGISANAAETVRTIVKLCVGTFSAATLFLANYYGKLAVERKAEDSRRMAFFYESILQSWDYMHDNPDFLAQIAREELIENGKWFSYNQDNKPDLIL